MNTEQRKEANQEGWLDSKMHVAKVMYWLITGKLPRPDGDVIRLDASTLPKFFEEVGEKYKRFNPQEYLKLNLNL